LVRGGVVEEVAATWARAKAEAVSPRHSGALVIGAD
jgi:predicted house-cleaning NTP pyrophosphatase (Maf/HAM1 superfamily)